MAWLKGILIVAAALALLLFLVGQLGWLRGSAPSRLGLDQGRLKPPSKSPNSVSSQADLWPDHPQREYARIAPLPAAPNADAAWARLRQEVAAMPGARIVESEGDYLRVEFSTRWLKFTDDAEFSLDRSAGVTHVRSASRLGRADLGVNRARVEDLRAQLAAAG